MGLDIFKLLYLRINDFLFPKWQRNITFLTFIYFKKAHVTYFSKIGPFRAVLLYIAVESNFVVLTVKDNNNNGKI